MFFLISIFYSAKTKTFFLSITSIFALFSLYLNIFYLSASYLFALVFQKMKTNWDLFKQKKTLAFWRPALFMCACVYVFTCQPFYLLYWMFIFFESLQTVCRLKTECFSFMPNSLSKIRNQYFNDTYQSVRVLHLLFSLFF